MRIEIAERPPQQQMTGPEFRAFQDTRPDHERWELIAGVPTMMVPPTIQHNRIAYNLARLLDDALEQHDASRVAVPQSGLELDAGNYKPEPDVYVIDADFVAGQRFAEGAYLLAEVVSSTDDVRVPGTGRPWIDVKREIYLAQEKCEVVMIIQQDWIEVRVDVRTATGWQSQTLSGADAELALPSFGLRCRLEALYAGTPLFPRKAGPPKT
jgi:Uma2 family endonuclease